MNYNGIIFDLALQYGSNVANVDVFCDYVVSKLELANNVDYSGFIGSIKRYLKAAEHQKNCVANSFITDQLVINELKRYDFSSEYKTNPQEIQLSIDAHADKLLFTMSDIGLMVDKSASTIFFCDKFPKPFDNNQGKALAPDSYDAKQYGMDEGIYFLRSNVSFYQSRLLLAHELLHKVCSKNNPELLARGLEDGICELLGSLYLNMKLFPIALVKNYISFRRLKYGTQNQKFKLYTEYMRMAYKLYMLVGINGLITVLNNGRKYVKEVETLLTNGNFVEISVENPPLYDTDFEQFASELLLCKPENEVVSPMAYYVLLKYNAESKISEFAQTNHLYLDECVSAFKEIQQRIYGCVIDGDHVEFSDISQLVKNGSVRFDIEAEMR